jgi:Ni,Fe-hydrogenase III large subunit/Ni,Fe-hydrogenase III component G
MNVFRTSADARPVAAHRHWLRAIVGTAVWTEAISELAAGRHDLVALWGEPAAVHLALRNRSNNELITLTLECPGGAFPSVARLHPPALRLERAIRDLYGLEPDGLTDHRPWLDHGQWGVRHPLAACEAAAGQCAAYTFLPATGESLHQIGVGPVHAGIIEPGYFLFQAGGETVVRLEERLGYVHRGIESLMMCASLDHAIKLAGRVSGDSTVAYAFAFARAAEAALEIEVPVRAAWLRALMAECERIANHFGDFGAICNDASFAIMQAQCAMLREKVLRCCAACFGHRMMRDGIIVGGMNADVDDHHLHLLSRLVLELARRLPRLAELYDKTASLQDRTVGTGILKAELAQQYACGGFIGRASGRGFDARKAHVFAPYDQLMFEVAVLDEGDVNARVWIRIREIEQSLSIVRQILDQLPSGPISDATVTNNEPCEGAALVEGFRGDIFVWMRIAKGRIERCHLRDPRSILVSMAAARSGNRG